MLILDTVGAGLASILRTVFLSTLLSTTSGCLSVGCLRNAGGFVRKTSFKVSKRSLFKLSLTSMSSSTFLNRSFGNEIQTLRTTVPVPGFPVPDTSVLPLETIVWS